MIKAADRYKCIQVMTASPGRLVQMMFDAAVRGCARAKAALEQGDALGARKHLISVQDIVVELRSALNLESGKMAETLWGLYDYVYHRLVHASVSGDEQALGEAQMIVSGLRDAWREMLEGRGEDG
ncbi:MAG: flagellar export chaperone FliS [Bacillota bacterium]